MFTKKLIVNSKQELIESSLRSRRAALGVIYHAKSGHPGGSLSCIDLITALFAAEKIGKEFSISHLILSKGHAAPALYAVAADFNIVDPHELLSFRKINSILQGHPDVNSTQWVETSTGSLGQGLSVALGMALGFKYQNKSKNVFAVVGDGELQEGEVWESAMSAAKFRLDNLCVFIDYNKIQSDDFNSNIMPLEPLGEKWAAFNWNVLEIDGHNFAEILASIKVAKNFSGGPTVVIAHTIKGKGVSFMENIPAWHGSVTLKEEELVRALQDLKTEEKLIQEYISGKIWYYNE